MSWIRVWTLRKWIRVQLKLLYFWSKNCGNPSWFWWKNSATLKVKRREFRPASIIGAENYFFFFFSTHRKRAIILLKQKETLIILWWYSICSFINKLVNTTSIKVHASFDHKIENSKVTGIILGFFWLFLWLTNKRKVCFIQSQACNSKKGRPRS